MCGLALRQLIHVTPIVANPYFISTPSFRVLGRPCLTLIGSANRAVVGQKMDISEQLPNEGGL